MYSPMPRRSGRDSIRVEVHAARTRTRPGRTRASPASPEPAPQKTSAVLAGPARAAGGARGRRGEPGEAGGVAGLVLELLGQHHGAVARARASRAPIAARVPGALRRRPRSRTASAVETARRPTTGGARRHVLGAASARTGRAPADASSTVVISSSASSRPADEAVGRRAGRARRSAPRPAPPARARRAPGPRRPRARSRPATSARSTVPRWTASTTSRSVASGHGLQLRARPRQRLVAERPGEARDRRRARVPSLAQRDRADLAGEREPDASSSSGESCCSPRPAWTCLQYMRAVSRWAIDESTTPLWSASSSAIVVDWWPDISP